MDSISSELVGLIYQLLPGFVALWIFYGLTGYEPHSPFERVIEALIFTILVRPLVIGIKAFALMIGRNVESPWGWWWNWTDGSDLAWGVVLAIIVGFTVATCANLGVPHKWLRKIEVDGLRLTPNTTDPSEWYGAFKSRREMVTLYLKDKRRVFGWPNEWPNHSDRGHFVLEEVEWLLDDGTRAPLYNADALIIAASDVAMVEIARPAAAVTASPDQLKFAEEILLEAQKPPPDKPNEE